MAKILNGKNIKSDRFAEVTILDNGVMIEYVESATKHDIFISKTDIKQIISEYIGSVSDSYDYDDTSTTTTTTTHSDDVIEDAVY